MTSVTNPDTLGRYTGHRGFDPRSATAALVVNGLLVAGLIFSAPHILPNTIKAPPTITTYPVPLPTDPPPMPKQQQQPEHSQPRPTPPIPAPDPVIPMTNTDSPPIDVTDILPTELPPIPGGTGTGSATGGEAKPAPVLSDARPVASRLGDFQPDYPASERRAGRDGTVTVRVRVGSDGRVKAVERVAATSDAFFDATRRRALSAWRFEPATRDGQPVASWAKMTVRFVLKD